MEPSVKATSFLSLRNVSKQFGPFTALLGVDLDVAEQEFICLLGPSGCGKSTLLRIIAGLETASNGSLSCRGSDITDLDPGSRKFGMLFQSYALFPNLNAEQNISYGMKDQDRRQRAARVQELLALVGLEGFAKKYPNSISGGQQQRIALARALAPSPRLLLLDEPLSALDARIRAHLRVELKLIQKKLGVTTVMVTHDQEEALTMADRIAVMNDGQIEQIGTPTELYRAPATPFVASFIGTMNRFEGRIDASGRLALADVNVAVRGERRFDVAKGQSVEVYVRPEQLKFVIDAADDFTSFEAVVENIEFSGPFTRFDVRIASIGTDLVKVDLPSASAVAQSISVGTKIRVGFAAENAHVFSTLGHKSPL